LGPIILSSGLFSNTLSLYVLPLILESKFHTHTKLQAKLQFCVFNLYVFRHTRWQNKRSELNSKKHYPNLISS
jgi:hypothetical protein